MGERQKSGSRVLQAATILTPQFAATCAATHHAKSQYKQHCKDGTEHAEALEIS